MTRPTKIGMGVALAALVAIAAYWYFSPYLAIHEINVAVRAQNFDALNEHVDYPRLRESLKDQLSAQLATRLAQKDASTDTGSGFKGLGVAIVASIVDRMVDAIVRPAAVMAMMRRAKLETPGDRGVQQANPAANDHENPAPRWVFQRNSVDRLIAYAPDGHESALDTHFGVVFERDGFANWKVVGIHLPVAR